VLTNRARRRHRRKDVPQAIDQAAFLINAPQWLYGSIAGIIKQLTDLLGGFHVASEQNYAARLISFD